ncbi:hypothetical protein QR98_0068380 [Sarcoptes scabiei]|uniref:Uncharacterized protein n=1 Tax=Sarcoptes scabiei TaxID=52283 RepID=A0A132ABG4_SARSC|nr:hypothetical protein QR98_0068380 [Sarcoptes scabiei]
MDYFDSILTALLGEKIDQKLRFLLFSIYQIRGYYDVDVRKSSRQNNAPILWIKINFFPHHNLDFESI